MLFTASSKASTFSFISAISGLISFTLSHCGSYAPLSTLTLGITTSELRLGTGCWLDFTRQAFLLYDISLNPSGSIARHGYLLPCLAHLPDYEILLAHRALAKFYLTYKAKRKPKKEELWTGLKKKR